MFGYVQPLKPELKIREFACYRSYYCGVCKALGDGYGQVSRFTVTYDAAFLALLNSSLVEDGERVCFERCIVNPLKPKPVVRENAAVRYAAAVNLLMAYFKLKDGWRDERSIPSLLAFRILSPYIRRIRSAYPAVYEAVHEQLGRLALVEAENVSSVDAAAEPFARLLSIVLPAPQQGKTERRVLEWMGYNLGKWIYVVDAFSDIESDIRSGNYNVLVARYGKDTHAWLSGDDISSQRNGENTPDQNLGQVEVSGSVWQGGESKHAMLDKEGASANKDGKNGSGRQDRVNKSVCQGGKSFSAWQTRLDRSAQQDEKDKLAVRIMEESRKEVEFILNTCLAEIGKAYELLDIKRNGGLLENIIFLGLPYKTQMVLDERGEGDGSIQGTRCKARCNSGGDKGGL
jgi:hypothetical protein